MRPSSGLTHRAGASGAVALGQGGSLTALTREMFERASDVEPTGMSVKVRSPADDSQCWGCGRAWNRGRRWGVVPAVR